MDVEQVCTHINKDRTSYYYIIKKIEDLLSVDKVFERRILEVESKLLKRISVEDVDVNKSN